MGLPQDFDKDRRREEVLLARLTEDTRQYEDIARVIELLMWHHQAVLAQRFVYSFLREAAWRTVTIVQQDCINDGLFSVLGVIYEGA